MPADGQPPPPPPGAPPPGRPEYKVYKSGRGLRDRLPAGGVGNPLERFRRGRKPDQRPGLPKPKRRITPGRVVKWVLLAVLAWVLLSVILFFVSASLQDGVSERTERALSSGGSLATGSTVLVVGSDKRPKGQEEPGFSGERADTIILMHVGVGSVRRLSILRDSYVDGDAGYTGKINGAFSNGGGSARLIEVLEEWLGNDLEINHVIETDLEDFPDFIDAIGGIDVNVRGNCRSGRFGGRTIRLKTGEQHLDGQEAVDYSRLRCAGRLPDLARVRKQQDVVSGIKDQVLSPSTFLRLPLVAWNAPKPMNSDMQGPGLSLLFADLATGGTGKPLVLEPDSFSGPGGSILVDEETRQEAVEELLGE